MGGIIRTVCAVISAEGIGRSSAIARGVNDPLNMASDPHMATTQRHVQVCIVTSSRPVDESDRLGATETDHPKK
jgi:hypothetical protein